MEKNAITNNAFAGRVAVVYGGNSAERAISLKSGQAVYEALLASGVDAELVDFPARSVDYLIESAFDCVFIALHGRGGEDGTLQGALELAGLPYTGSGVLGSALAMDKVKTKLIWQAMQLPTPKGQHLYFGDDINEQALRAVFLSLGPCLAVKPVNEGSSVGISKVSDPQALASSYKEALKYDQQVMAEQWIEGEEFTVGIVGEQVLPSIHLEAANTFYDYEAKYLSSLTQYHCPSGLSEKEEKQLSELAFQAFKSLGCRGWGRVDFIRDKKGQFLLLEVNTIPGMTETSLVPKAAAVIGWDFSRLVHEIIATAGCHE